jgi:hypothetical protein
MKLNLVISKLQQILTASIGSLVLFTLLFQTTFYAVTGSAIAAEIDRPYLLVNNSLEMANQVQGQLDLEQKGTVDKKNTQYGAATKGTQKIDRDRSSQDRDRVNPTVEYTNKDMSNQLNETEKAGKGAGMKAAEKGGELLDNVKGLFDKK